MELEKSRRLKKALKEHLKPSRYEHSIGVAYTAMALAMRYGCDMDKAGEAGFLHDWAKQYGEKEIVEKCKDCGLPLTKDELACPAVLHAKLGAYLAKKDFGVEDEEVLKAIQYHTTGRPEMSLLELILYVADYIEPGRDRAPNLTSLRKQAFMDIEKAAAEIMEDTIEYLTENKKPIDSMTLQAYAYYQTGEKKL